MLPAAIFRSENTYIHANEEKKMKTHPPAYLVSSLLEYSCSHWVQRVLFKQDYNMLIYEGTWFVFPV